MNLVEQIIKSLEENSITRLTMLKSYGSKRAQILEKLAQNNSVQIFDASNSMADDRSCAQSLKKVLSSNQSITLLDLSGNDFVDDNYLRRVFDKTVSQNFSNRAQKMTLMLHDNNRVTSSGLEHLQRISNIEVKGIKAAKTRDPFSTPTTAPATNGTALGLATSKSHGLE